MDTKLTLKLDKAVIEQAKVYAGKQKRSLSRIIESYLKLLINQKSIENDEFPISPFIKSMATGINIPSDIDLKNEYSHRLAEKYR